MTRERETLEDFLDELDYAAEVDMALTFDGPNSKRAAETIRGEVERLQAWATDEQRGRHKAEEDRMNARSEIERLTAESANRYWEGRWRDEKAENERLKAALTEIISLKPEDMPHAVENSQAAAIARAALAPGPVWRGSHSKP